MSGAEKKVEGLLPQECHEIKVLVEKPLKCGLRLECSDRRLPGFVWQSMQSLRLVIDFFI